MLAWLAGIALVLVVLDLLGVDVRGWLSDLWDALSGVGLGYLLAGWTLQTAQTTLTALGWYFILRAAYPSGRVAYLQVLAAYAVGPALNGVLPANIGTVVMLLMFVAIIPGANLPGVLGGMVVQKIFFTRRRRVRLRLPVPLGAGLVRSPAPRAPRPPACWRSGSWPAPAMLLLVLGRIFWRKLKGLWAKAVQGGAILARRARVRAQGGAAVVRRVAGQARRDRRVPRRLRHRRHASTR